MCTKRKHCCGNIFGFQCFPVFPHTQHTQKTHANSEFFQKHFASATNVSSFACSGKQCWLISRVFRVFQGWTTAELSISSMRKPSCGDKIADNVPFSYSLISQPSQEIQNVTSLLTDLSFCIARAWYHVFAAFVSHRWNVSWFAQQGRKTFVLLPARPRNMGNNVSSFVTALTWKCKVQ